MKIILANPRGFCAGVNMAIHTVDEALKIVGSPLYVYHEIVHNRHVVNDFIKKGVIFVDTIDEVPANQTVVFSAHGVSPAVRNAAKGRGCTLIDATCPLVTKVHMEAIRYARQGYSILLVGHAGHDEVVGTVGEAPNAIVIVESPEDVARLPFTAFGEGTDKGMPNRAKPEIWKDAAKFKAASDKMVAEIAKLETAAKAGNLDAIKAAMGGVGGSCKGCHDDFRAEKYSAN